MLTLLWVLPLGAPAAGGSLARVEPVRKGPVPAISMSAAAVQTPSAFRLPDLPIDTFSLDNGLRVVVSEDASTPIVAVSVWYHAGSAREGPGESGFAHVLEHLLSSGGAGRGVTSPAGQIERAGGVHDASTDLDRISFVEVVPAARLELALRVQARRMAELPLDPEGLRRQREVVREELRLSRDLPRFTAGRLVVDTLAERGFAPYRHPVVGTMADLERASSDDVRAFHRRVFTPDRAVLTVVGDVEAAEVRSLARALFGGLRPGPELPPWPAPPPPPRAGGERRSELEDARASHALVWIAYRLPPLAHADAPALELLARVLAGSESSRLNTRLHASPARAGVVTGRVAWRKGPSLLLLGARAAPDVSAESLERSVRAEVARLTRDGITDQEWKGARNQARMDAVLQRMTVQDKASLLQRAVLLLGAPQGVNHEIERLAAVSASDIQRVARTYLVAGNRTVVVVRPRRAGGR